MEGFRAKAPKPPPCAVADPKPPTRKRPKPATPHPKPHANPEIVKVKPTHNSLLGFSCPNIPNPVETANTSQNKLLLNLKPYTRRGPLTILTDLS